MPGTFDLSMVVVRCLALGAAGTVILRGGGTRPGAASRGAGAPSWGSGRAVTAQVPGLIPRTSAVTATGPLPGTMPR
jgi:hypothetical protein